MSKAEVKAAAQMCVTRAAAEWLAKRGMQRGDERPSDYVRRLADYCRHMQSSAPTNGDEWARRVVASYRAGEPVTMYSVEAAFEQLGIHEPVLRHSPAARPDVRDIQAGDTEWEGF